MDLAPLGIAALSLLAERAMHPYEMYQTLLHRREDRNVKVRPGSLYHAVDRLVRAGFVEALGVERSGNRPERTSYAITDAGRHALQARVAGMLATPAEEYPEFRLAVAEAHTLPVEEVVALLISRRTILADQLHDLELSRLAVVQKAIPDRFVLDLSYQLALLHADIAWLDEATARLADGRTSWADPVPDQLKENAP